MPYYAFVKTQEEKKVVASNHNAEVMPMLNAYLKEKEPQKGGKTLLWVLVLLVVAAAFVVYHRCYKKKSAEQQEAIRRDLQEARGTIEAKELEALRLKVDAIYNDRLNNKAKRIIEVFNEAYPEALAKLKAAYPDLSDTELDICVLSFFPFRMKEIADILDLRENTVSKYRTTIKKKTQSVTIEGLIKPFIG